MRRRSGGFHQKVEGTKLWRPKFLEAMLRDNRDGDSDIEEEDLWQRPKNVTARSDNKNQLVPDTTGAVS